MSDVIERQKDIVARTHTRREPARLAGNALPRFREDRN